jgi:thiamine-monophosphate kinase
VAFGEFELIARYFQRPQRPATGTVALGVGDDCALLQPRPGTQIAVSCDMLVEERHFFRDVDPATLGHKALAVNLSDLAACGARPLACTLALALPRADEAWLSAFARGLFALADVHDCQLIGGDTTRGPLNICITVFGEVPVVDGRSQALLRSGARPGDEIWVSGTLGEARLALEALQGKLPLNADVLRVARARLECPTPRVALGLALRGVANACIDLSDGLMGDLGHVLELSHCGATLDTASAAGLLAVDAGLDHEQRLALVLGGGDDYELLFTAPVSAREAVLAAGRQADTPVTRIGRIEAAPGLHLVDAQGRPVSGRFASFDHFAQTAGP